MNQKLGIDAKTSRNQKFVKQQHKYVDLAKQASRVRENKELK
jgi:hypothetical protein